MNDSARPSLQPRPLALRLIGDTLNLTARLTPRLAARASLSLMMRPPRVRLNEEQQRWLNQANQRDVDYRHGHVRVYRFGTHRDPPVLLAHGWGASPLLYHAWVQALAADGMQPVLIDLPAHGASSGRKTDGLRIARALANVRHEIGPLAGIVAHSFAGFASLIALRDGLDFDRLVLINAPTEPDHLIRDLQSMLGLHDPLTERIREQIDRYLNAPFSTFDAIRFVPALGTRALVIHDIEDWRTPVEQGRRLAGAWPRAEARYTKGLGHNRILGNERVIAAATAFLRDEAIPDGPPFIMGGRPVGDQ